MKVNKFKKVQYKRNDEIERLLKNRGLRIRPLKDKIRIEGEDRLRQSQPTFCTSAAYLITWNRYSGHFRYIETYNKKETPRLTQKSYVISNEEDKQVRIYDDRHSKFHYHDIKYDLNVIRDFFIQNVLPVLWYPYQVIFQIIYGMFRPSYPHAAVILKSKSFMQIPLPRLPASHFHPASKLTGIQWEFL